MTDDDIFLRAILDAPALATPRLVYADWLDDQGDPVSARKAEFLRLETRVAEAPERGLDRVRFTGRLRLLALHLDPDWLAVVAHPVLEACRVRFQFECPARWDRLTPTADVRVRHCTTCDRAVYICRTVAEARGRAAGGDCVAMNPALTVRRGELDPPRQYVLTPEQLDRLRESSTMRIGVIFPTPPGPGIRPAPKEALDHWRERPLRVNRRKRRSKRVRPEDMEE